MATRHTSPRTAAAGAISAQAFREFLRTYGLLDRFMQPYFAKFGISGSGWGVLRNLHRAEQEGQSGLRLSDLSERMLIRPPSVTGVVDRLERDGLVARRADPADQRAKRVGLTRAGRQLIQQVLAGHERKIELIMAGLSAREQSQLHDLLVRLRGHLENFPHGPILGPG
jgi:DNA-binding MarR family transcriptional regulator